MNLFDGDSYKAQYTRIAYRLLITRKSVCNQDIIDEFYRDFPNKKPKYYTEAIGYGELKKGVSELIKAIRNKEGQDSIEEKGNNRKKFYIYKGENSDPLSDIINLRTVNSLKEFWFFCKNSSGFIPEIWFEYFFKNTRQLLDIKDNKKEGKSYIFSEIDRGLKNFELLPYLYEVIQDKKILKIKYKFLEKEELIFHPHLLKEYNGRWFLFGHAVGLEPEFGFNLPLDRILEKPEIVKNNQIFHSAPTDFYINFFKDIVGVTHDDNWPQVEEIIIRVRNYRMFNLVYTKPFHSSQKVTRDYDKEQKYGEFKVAVKINNEFVGRILQLGAGIEIVSPPHVRELFKQRISNMMALYNQEPTE